MPTNLRHTIKHYGKQLKLRVTKQVYEKGPTKNIYDISLTIQSTVMTTKFTYQATRTRIIIRTMFQSIISQSKYSLFM